jgi:uncharacterized protein YbaP (TraB family)
LRLLLALFMALAAAALRAGNTLAPAPAQTPAAGAPAAPAKQQAFSKGLLWRIEPPKGEASYLYGTMHTADPRVTNLPAPVRSTFDQASSYAMELLINADGIASMAEAMFFEHGQTLPAVLGEDLYRQARQALLDDGIPTGDLERKKPWVVIMLLSTPRSEPGLPLDLRLQLQATLEHKPTYGLESMQEQIAVFNGMSLPDQVMLLKDTLRYRTEVNRQFEDLVRAYLARDLTNLMSIVQGAPGDNTRAFQTMMERLLYRRNRVMLERMQPRLQEGNCFIAVGAAHLPGKQGLLNLLQEAGYRVSVIY